MSVETLRRRLRRGQLLPFVGAGASMSVHWGEESAQKRGPSWTELVDWAARDLGFQSAELLRVRTLSDLSILEYYAIKKGGLGTLANWLNMSMQAPDPALQNSPIHTGLAQLGCAKYYTTNYDSFLERALRLNGRSATVVCREQDSAVAKPDECEVVKFHGDLNYPETLVLSETQYHERRSFTTAMDFRLLSDLLNRVILFVGFSFTDPNISYLFHLVQQRLGGSPDNRTEHRAYIIAPDPSDFEIQLFRKRGIGVLPYRGPDHTAGVSAILTELCE